jgi:hypothetical protein
VAIPCAGLHPLIFHWVARIVRALDLVGGTDVAVVGLAPLALLEEVAEDLVENSNIIKASGWVGTLDPYQAPPYNSDPNFVAEGRLPRVLVGGKPVPRLCLSCLRDPEIGPPSMVIGQSLPTSYSFRSSKSICVCRGGSGGGVRTGC